MEVLYFVHVPKCAGTTVEEHLLESLPSGTVLRPEKSAPVIRYLMGRGWNAPVVANPSEVRMICGHFFGRATGSLLPPHERLEAILLRDPVGLFLSWYNYRMTRHRAWGRPIPKFEDWYRSQGRNPVARHLLTRHLGWSELKFVTSPANAIVIEARRALDDFWFVAEYRHVDAFLAEAAQRLGAPTRAQRRNITRYEFLNRDDLPADVAEKIRTENAIDEYLAQRYSNRLFDKNAAAEIAAPEGGRLVADEIHRLLAWTTIRVRR